MNFTKLFLAVGATLILSLTNYAEAQRRASIRFSGKTTGEEFFSDQMTQYEEAAAGTLRRRVAILKEPCGLTDQQVRKLDVAARGAAAKFVTKKREQEHARLRQTQKMAGFEFDEQGELIADVPFARIRPTPFNMTFRSPTLVQESDLWKRSVNKVLTEEQKQVLDTLNEAAENRRRDAVVRTFIARMDFHMNLKFSQIEKLNVKISADPLADMLTKKMLYEELALENAKRVSGGAEKLKESKFEYLVEDILNEQQLGKWKMIFEPELHILEAEVKQLKGIVAPERRAE